MPDRRQFLGYLSLASLLASGRYSPDTIAGLSPLSESSPLTFRDVAQAYGVDHALAQGYRATILLRWGDGLDAVDATWSAGTVDGPGQARQFGYNNDFIAYFPLPRESSSNERGLLCVNHEFTSAYMMWPGLTRASQARDLTPLHAAAEMAAIGHSVVEIRREQGTWRLMPSSSYNRRITADTPIKLAGPAAEHARLRTRQDNKGLNARGVLNPCGGGKTPWGTVLIGDENFNIYFGGRLSENSEANNHARYGVGAYDAYPWWRRHQSRFDLALEPREANRHGWVVEVDPYAPDSMPVKRTALGRFKHEAASCVLSRDGRVVVYMGDDEPFEFLYRYVSKHSYAPHAASDNTRLLDEGDLSVARFADDGSLKWIALRHGNGPLTAANGFRDQGDVLIEARRAATLLGATRLDRPEDVEANPLDGFVYAMLTNNTARSPDDVDAANPRAANAAGHILRLRPPGAPGAMIDHAADEFSWEVFLLAGNPAKSGSGAHYPGNTGANGWFAAPDNCAFDPSGRLWIASDQGRARPSTGFGDGLWAHGVDAEGEAVFKCFFRAPLGGEVCGPEFTPDGRTLFLAVQHPGADVGDGSNFDTPATRWPDFKDGIPPRPSVLAITRDDDGLIGT